MRHDYDDDEDDGPGFFPTLILLSVTAAGGWFLYKSLTGAASAATIPTSGLLAPSTPLDDIVTQVGVLLDGEDGTANDNRPVGIRNNNPGNIKWSAANPWDGQTGQDARGFAIFSDPIYGLRAAFKVLQTYDHEISPLGTFDVLSVSRRWTATQQDAWANNVSRYSGLGLTDPLRSDNQVQMQALLNGIVAAENGAGYAGYYAGTMAPAYDMAA